MSTFDLYDVNCRIGRFPWGEVGDESADPLLRRMDRFGIARALVSHTASWRHDPATGNDLIVRVVADHPRLRPCWVAVPGTCAELAAPEQFVRDALRCDVGAIRVYPDEHGFDLDSAEFGGYLGAFEQAGLPVIVDLAATSWAAIDAVAAAHPDLALIVCEIGYRVLRRAAAVLERHANVFLDLSDLSSHEGLEWLCQRFGPGRLIFGTGAPLRDPGEAVTRLLWSDLDAGAVSRIASSTLCELVPGGVR
ncbi:MAG TPA: amidohydrolase family protein [Micromonosporaceae bacterium]|jgi:predicted TIM-barrel fold metal-dependent hydrolase